MIFKGFKFGKSKDNGKGKSGSGDSTATQIAELEEHLKDRTNNLKQTEKKLSKLSEKVNDIVEIDIAPVRPHGPIKELSIGSEDTLDDVDIDEGVIAGDALEETVEDIKLVEKPVESEPPPVTGKGTKSNYDSDSLKALFTSVEEDENPLANLINSLPEITIDELEEDLKEIKDIIKDWQQK
ncbi:MAG: hypothetical protein A2Y58_05900 [Chloroflexi bacterium RBG_13_51_52]|nr:MAG: hypothetical protein A2Y58_05900 [Chloroflexi bacterium RBG_13_51_52]